MIGVADESREFRRQAKLGATRRVAKHRFPTDRQKRVVKERDTTCVDCGRHDLLTYDHNPNYSTTGHTIINELELRCAPCHWQRHRDEPHRNN